jgi:hypothetical protein
MTAHEIKAAARKYCSDSGDAAAYYYTSGRRRGRLRTERIWRQGRRRSTYRNK